MLANSSLGRGLTFWAIVTSLLLPLFVGLEAWFMRRDELKSRALRIDATLAIRLLLLAVGNYPLLLGALRHVLIGADRWIAVNNGPPQQAQSNACTSTILSAVNNQFGTNFLGQPTGRAAGTGPSFFLLTNH